MKKKWFIPCFIIIFIVAILSYMGIQKAHTFTLANRDGTMIKGEQIQPLFDTIKVSSDCDTAVTFTDIETGKTYAIGYITLGISEKVSLQKGKWYTVEGARNITLRPVNLRIE